MRTKRMAFILMMLTGYNSLVWSQTKISGKISDEKRHPLEYASVVVLNSIDSGFVSGTITDTSGIFSIEKINPGNYILTFSMIGYEKKHILQSVEKDRNIKLGEITLKEESYQVQGITVLGKRVPIRTEPGKIIVNLSSALLSSNGNVLDALKKLPGVIVKNDGTIILNGQTGINVLVDDKLTYLSGENLINILLSMPVTSVEKIELISQPSSRYDAAGNSGIINIQRKKTTSEALNFSASSGVERGRYTRNNNSASLYFRRNRLNFFADYSFYQGKNFVDLISSRAFLNSEKSLPVLLKQNITANREMHYRSYYAKTGANFDFSNKLTGGVYFSLNRLIRRQSEISKSDFYSTNTQNDSLLTTFNNIDFGYKNTVGGINILHKWNEKGKWDAAFDFHLFEQSDSLNQNSSFRIPSQTITRDTLTGKTGGNINIFSTQTNLNYIISDRITVTAGAKSVFVTTKSKTFYETMNAGTRTKNDDLNCNFVYSENINAGYIQANYKWSSIFSIETGFRIEDTNATSLHFSNEKDSAFQQKYTYLFPTLTAQYQPSADHALAIGYSKRIIRPNYRDLNPFVQVNDRFLSEKGNTELKPELINNFDFSWAYRKHVTINLFYSDRKNPITKSYIAKGNGKILIMPLNLTQNHSMGIRAGMNNLVPFKWWTVHLNSSLIYKTFHWVIGNNLVENRLVTPMVQMSNQLTLPCGWKIEATGYYIGNMVEGQAEIHPLWVLSAGIRKKILNGKLNIHIYANDILLSNRPFIEVNSGSLKGWYEETRDTGAVGFTLSYRFNRGSETKKIRNRDIVNESKRINL